MAKLLLKVLVAAAALASALPLQMTAANAQGVEFYIGNGRRPPPPPYYDDYRPSRYRGCSPGDAVNVARNYGVRRARVAEVTSRRVVVTGIGNRGERTSMVLANDPSCRRLR